MRILLDFLTDANGIDNHATVCGGSMGMMRALA